MLSFNIQPVQTLPAQKAEQISRDLSGRPMGDMLIDWCRYVQTTALNPVEIRIITIHQNRNFCGAAVLTLIRKFKWPAFLPSPLNKAFALLKFKKRNPFFLNIGILNIPLMHRPGLLSMPWIAPAEYARIHMELIHYLRDKKFGMHALCICTDPSCGIDRLSIRENLIGRPYDFRTLLEYPHDSFEKYYSSLPGKRRQDIRRSKNALQKFGGTIESSVDFYSAAEDVTRLYHQMIKANSDMQLIGLGRNFFSRLHELQHGSPQFFLARIGTKVIGFCFAFQSAGTLFLKSCGLDHELSLKTDAYFNLYYQAMDYASRQGFTRIDCGWTKNLFKEYKLRCRLIPVTYWIDFYHPLLRPLKYAGRLFRSSKPDQNNSGESILISESRSA